ncbi:MAG: hypothetical protein LBJ70_00590, partial [Holosporales bacterium]|nr:hypothetical protein [Holosporales bacterium]
MEEAWELPAALEGWEPAEEPEFPAALGEEAAEELAFPTKGCGEEEELGLAEKLELPIEELVGKIEGAEPEEEKLFLSKEEEKLLLPRDRRECEEISLLNGAAPPPPGNL